MAALDFPSSPTVGQIFGGSNGINYQWNGTLWLAVGGIVSPSPGGDFHSIGIAAPSGVGSIPASTATLIRFKAPNIGNAGGWYNSSTGRYTPPAGSFFIYASLQAYTSAAGAFVMRLLKNGVIIAQTDSVTNVTTNQNMFVSDEVTASGTDYFEIQALTGGVTGTPNTTTDVNSVFFAYPLSGIKGPPGDPGQLGFRLISTQTVSSAVAQIDFTSLPSDINHLKLAGYAVPVTNDAPFAMRIFDGTGALDVANNYQSTGVFTGSTNATGAAAVHWNYGPSANFGLTYPGTNNGVSSTVGFGGITFDATIPAIRNAAGRRRMRWNAGHINGAGSALYNLQSSHEWTNSASILTGLRLFFGVGNIASGAVSVWGSP